MKLKRLTSISLLSLLLVMSLAAFAVIVSWRRRGSHGDASTGPTDGDSATRGNHRASAHRRTRTNCRDGSVFRRQTWRLADPRSLGNVACLGLQH